MCHIIDQTIHFNKQKYKNGQNWGSSPKNKRENITQKGNLFIFINNLCVIANDEIYCFFTNLYPKIISMHWGFTPQIIIGVLFSSINSHFLVMKCTKLVSFLHPKNE
jgi:hypothetical protein